MAISFVVFAFDLRHVIMPMIAADRRPPSFVVLASLDISVAVRNCPCLDSVKELVEVVMCAIDREGGEVTRYIVSIVVAAV